ncbi:MAG: hypothetical protein J0G35_00925 [Acidobacteriales bacterium]|nr:hypothetical protein [Terriglobales bacterium]
METMFGGCSIACHHDFERSSVNMSKFPSTVTFVNPSHRTFWGHISLVHAELAALRLLYEKSAPDWFYILSGSDYPVREASLIMDDLNRSEVDGYVVSQLIQKREAIAESSEEVEQFATWHDVARHRYLETMLKPDFMREIESASDVTEATRLLQERYSSILIRVQRFLPRNLSCYAGDHWITGNRTIASVLLSENSVISELLDFFHFSAISDEAIYQTLLCNSSSLRLENQNRRYADWTSADGHPKTLGTSDLPAIWTSRAHFARKFNPDTPVLDALDVALGISNDRSSKSDAR